MQNREELGYMSQNEYTRRLNILHDNAKAIMTCLSEKYGQHEIANAKATIEDVNFDYCDEDTRATSNDCVRDILQAWDNLLDSDVELRDDLCDNDGTDTVLEYMLAQ